MAATKPVPLRSIKELMAEAASHITEKIVRENIQEQRKHNHKLAGPSGKGKQKVEEVEEGLFASNEETSEEDEITAGGAMEELTVYRHNKPIAFLGNKAICVTRVDCLYYERPFPFGFKFAFLFGIKDHGPSFG
ncbi:uncharacterized protein A4U43_C03F23210 [Asparagus officinalis]|uniref:Uncharacterized protein n=1 Tax=Asparagus officinalis TaxID=4686 RepID=A0A5P1FCE2_ASPOF|nr:uncharacterized protein A4U43_C03F23210 [Asparagus officinalis]